MQRPEEVVHTMAPGLGDLASAYDLLLCDVFGTLYDARGIFTPALDALARFRARGGTVVLVSNAALTGLASVASLTGRGIGCDLYDDLVTAADVTRAFLAERGVRHVLHIGPAAERALFEGHDVTLCNVEDAEIAVCTGYPSEEPDGLLDRMRARNLDLVCTNPDREVLVAGQRLRFAGLVAEAYTARGGRVIATGKPDPSIYEAALERARRARGRSIAPDRVLAVGDTVALDVAGALACGFDALHVTTESGLAPAHVHRAPALVW